MGWQGKPLSRTTPIEDTLIAKVEHLERQLVDERAHADRLADVLARVVDGPGVYEDDVDTALDTHRRRRSS